MTIAVKLEAQNDPNGNPRRGWLVLDSLPFFVAEGASTGIFGTTQLFEKYGATQKAIVKVSASEFRRYKSGRFNEGAQI